MQDFFHETRLLLAFLLLGICPSLWAIDLKPEEIRGKNNQSPVTILQNRYFTKTFRPELGLSFGTITNEAYIDTTTAAVRGALFMNEWLGLELQSVTTKVTASDDRKALAKIVHYTPNEQGVLIKTIIAPEVNQIHKIFEANAIFAPFYGKINLSDWLIIYSDVYVTGGISRLNTDQGNLNAISYGAGQRFYWAKALSMRIDFRVRRYTETRNGQSYHKNAYSLDAGLSYFLF